MDNSFDIPDSTDWLRTPLSSLAPLESSLRCQVCKDFFNNPVITSCSHTFCSLCIRRCLSSEGKCPVCRSSDQELKLRRNWAVQEILDCFQNARPSILSLAKGPAGIVRTAEEGEGDLDQPATKKPRLDQPQTSGENLAQLPGRRSRRLQNRHSDDSSPVAQVQVIEDSEVEDFELDDGLVACPICNRRMKNEFVFGHLDTCIEPREKPNVALPSPLSTVPLVGVALTASNGSPQSMSRTPQRKSHDIMNNSPPQRLPAINYSILKEGVLRKKLRDLGIPDWGPRPLLQRRHTEWMNLWNANWDAKVPKSKRELLQELRIWEKTQGGGQVPNTAPSSGPNSVMQKDFNAAAWSANHSNDFKRLILSARTSTKAMIRSTIPQSSHEGDDEAANKDVVAEGFTRLTPDNNL